MNVTDMPIGDITPYEKNPRRNRKAVDNVAKSIQEFGWQQPIVVDEQHVIIAGHTRYQAARRLKHKTVPVVVAEGLTDDQAKAYRIMDNRSGEDASWVEDLLAGEMHELLDDGYDLSLTGFTGEQIQGLLSLGDEPEPGDDIPEDVETRCKPGDLWLLGKHRLKCGDSTLATDVADAMGDHKPHLMVTDPPYGVSYDAEWRTRAGLNADLKRGRVTNDQNADWREAWALFPGDVAYVWHAGVHAAQVADSLQAAGLEIRSQIIWVKNKIVVSRCHYHWQHEPCWYAVRKKGHWSGSRKQSTVWNIDKPVRSETGHSTQKPVECMKRPILNNSLPGHAVYDPFLGSGTTLIAAEQEGRICVGLELEPAYCDIIITRWENLTGEEAQREVGADNLDAVVDGRSANG